MKRFHRGFAFLVGIFFACSSWGVGLVHGDTASQQAIRADSAALAALNLKKPDNTPFTPNGAGVRLAIGEAVGIPELSPAHPSMPIAGPAAGANGRVTVTTPGAMLRSHSTTVTGIANEIAGQAIIFEAGNVQGTVNQRILNSQAMLNSGGNNASILNWSLASAAGGSSGTSLGTQWADWAAITQAGHPLQDKLIVIAGQENPPLASPWDNFNGITVGATSTNNYRQLATYNGAVGPPNTRNLTTDASPYGNGRVGRFKTDLVAPGGGDGVLLANQVNVGSAEDNFGPALTDNDGINSDPDYAGTSFAAPHVAGAGALLTEYGVLHGYSTDHRVLKAILLNGASKDVSDHVGAWDDVGLLAQKKNGQDIYIGWDGDLGTGLLDVSQSLLNYAPGEKNPGAVPLIAWDLQPITDSTQNSYSLTNPGKKIKSITATLAWDIFLQLQDTVTANQLWDVGETFNTQTLEDLDLEIWDTTDNKRVFFSTSDIDSIEHVSYTIPANIRAHNFDIRVNFFNDFNGGGADTVSYGLAWNAVAVPEPATLLSLMGIIPLALARSRSRGYPR